MVTSIFEPTLIRINYRPFFCSSFHFFYLYPSLHWITCHSSTIHPLIPETTLFQLFFYYMVYAWFETFTQQKKNLENSLTSEQLCRFQGVKRIKNPELFSCTVVVATIPGSISGQLWVLIPLKSKTPRESTSLPRHCFSEGWKKIQKEMFVRRKIYVTVINEIRGWI